MDQEIVDAAALRIFSAISKRYQPAQSEGASDITLSTQDLVLAYEENHPGLSIDFAGINQLMDEAGFVLVPVDFGGVVAMKWALAER